MHFISALSSGGSENMTIDMIKKIVNEKKDIKIVVIIMNNLVNRDLKQELLYICKDSFFLDREPGNLNPKHLVEIKKIIKRFNVDIIHTHDFGSRIRAVILSMFHFRINVVYTAHTTGLFKSMFFLDKCMHNICVKKTIAISDVVYKEAKDNKIKNVVKIYNGVDLDKFIFKNKKINLKKEINIINVARVDYKVKGQDILIKALKILKDNKIKFNCLFVGDNTKNFEKSFKFLQNLLEENDLKDNVLFLGNRRDVNILLQSADLFILPSRIEGFGLAIIEAMASGVPVICSDIEGPLELIENEKNGLLFKCENYFDLYKKIRIVLNDLKLYENLRQNAFLFSQKFDISHMINEYEKNYLKIINS
jgi:glycosyltransferase involved in cell wall biosynthesis